MSYIFQTAASALKHRIQLPHAGTTALVLVLASLLALLTPVILHSEGIELSNGVLERDAATDDFSTGHCDDKPAKPSPHEDFILAPGSGFSGETDLPEARGTGDGSDAKAIARWDVVPYQVFNKTMNVGVIAFHINKISKVSFSVEGGPWKDVTSMKLNPETNVVEYWITLRASDFADGPVEVRAIAYPVNGVPRVLQGKIPALLNSNTVTTNGEHSMWLFANSGEKMTSSQFFVSPSRGNDTNTGSSANPLKSLNHALTLASSHDGSTIILTEAGEYYPQRNTAKESNNTRWITVKRAEGLSKDEVVIVGKERNERLLPRITRLKWQGLTFRPDTYSYINEFIAGIEASQWYDDCLLKTPELEIGEVYPWRGNVYATDSKVDTFIWGFVNVLLARGCVAKDTLDVLQKAQMIVNCNVIGSRGASLAAQHHPDLYQSFGDLKNVIIYGVKGDDIDGMQIIFINSPLAEGPDMTDAAFVDIDVKTYDKNGGPPFSQLSGPLNNVLFQNVKVLKQKILFRTEIKDTIFKNVVFKNCQFHNKLFPRSLPRGIKMEVKPNAAKPVKS